LRAGFDFFADAGGRAGGVARTQNDNFIIFSVAAAEKPLIITNV
jgi:hypothetical protein